MTDRWANERAVQETLDALRAATSEARGMIKDIRNERKELKELRDEVVAAVGMAKPAMVELVTNQLGDEVKKGLEEYSKAIDEAIEKATQAVYRRFDTLSAVMLGEDDPDKETIATLVRRWRARKDI